MHHLVTHAVYRSLAYRPSLIAYPLYLSGCPPPSGPRSLLLLLSLYPPLRSSLGGPRPLSSLGGPLLS